MLDTVRGSGCDCPRIGCCYRCQAAIWTPWCSREPRDCRTPRNTCSPSSMDARAQFRPKLNARCGHRNRYSHGRHGCSGLTCGHDSVAEIRGRGIGVAVSRIIDVNATADDGRCIVPASGSQDSFTVTDGSRNRPPDRRITPPNPAARMLRKLVVGRALEVPLTCGFVVIDGC